MEFMFKITLVLILLIFNPSCEYKDEFQGVTIQEAINSDSITKLYNSGLSESLVTVAIIDTGVSPHPDILPNLIVFKDFVNNKTEIYDDNGHGTEITGIIAGTGGLSAGKFAGVAQSTGVIVHKVFDHSGIGSLFALNNSVDWLIKNQDKYNIRVVCMSFGFERNTYIDNPILKSLIDKLWDHNMIIVSSSGNNGLEEGEITIPSVYENVISVGSLKKNGEKKEISEFTSLYVDGKHLESKPNVYDIGENIITTSNDLEERYVTVKGTSFAAAIVSGKLALLLESNPYLANEQILYKIKKQDWGDAFTYIDF
jgi:serine protease AprX